jgi:hypothetical protein
MSGDDMHFAALHPNSRVIVTMPKFQQVKEIYFQGEGGLHSHLARMPKDWYNEVVAEQLQTIIRFRNGSVILAETPEPFTIRGHGPSKISIDEMNFIRKDRDLWLSALLPMTLTWPVYINVASTPWNKDSVYWDMCFNKSFKIFSGNIHEHYPPRYLRTWEDVKEPNGPLLLSQLETMREQYAGDPWRWKREMECDFTKPVKHGMAMALKQMMMTPRESDKKLLPADARRKFELPLDQDVQAELNVEQWEQTAGSEVYTFSHPEGSHDDRFWAICMAVKASMQSPPPGAGAVMLPH